VLLRKIQFVTVLISSEGKSQHLTRFDIIFSFPIEAVLMTYSTIVWCVLVSYAPYLLLLLFLFARCTVSLVSYLE